MEEDMWEDHDWEGKTTSGGELLRKAGPDAGCHAIEKEEEGEEEEEEEEEKEEE